MNINTNAFENSSSFNEESSTNQMLNVPGYVSSVLGRFQIEALELQLYIYTKTWQDCGLESDGSLNHALKQQLFYAKATGLHDAINHLVSEARYWRDLEPKTEK